MTLNGFTIPALSTRRAETDIELAERQSFVVAGLLDNRESESISKIPGLGSLPILGELFKSREVRRNRTELVMIVSPEMTRPLAPGEQLPVPYFPRDFLRRLEPSAPAAASPGKPVSEPSASGRHWYALKKSAK